jgi:hypothetical protein
MLKSRPICEPIIGEYVRKLPHGDPSAVEGRQWQQVENLQNDFEDQGILQVVSSPMRRGLRQEADEVEQQRGDHGEHNVRAGQAPF